MISINLRRCAVAAAAVAALAVPASASAGPLVASATDCPAQALSQPFLPWADISQYTPQPGGAFEDGAAGWTLNGASVGNGNEPWQVSGPTDSQSLTIANGGSATSGTICVGVDHPDIRFFARGSNSLASLTVQVLFLDGSGNTQSLPIGVLTGSNAWNVTPPLIIGVNLLPLLPDGRTPVAFRFSANGGSFQIDDVYVDPLSRW